MLILHEQGDGISLLVDSKQVDAAGDTTTSVIRLSGQEASILRAWLNAKPQPHDIVVTQT